MVLCSGMLRDGDRFAFTERVIVPRSHQHDNNKDGYLTKDEVIQLSESLLVRREHASIKGQGLITVQRFSLYSGMNRVMPISPQCQNSFSTHSISETRQHQKKACSRKKFHKRKRYHRTRRTPQRIEREQSLSLRHTMLHTSVRDFRVALPTKGF